MRIDCCDIGGAVEIRLRVRRTLRTPQYQNITMSASIARIDR